ncbi:thioesterase II family protein [Streptomyces sp. NRRL F-5635]|uniref:thioesterase II family protein n=1 Tax=Streptomyces sp. NRRL F-5635 TaxID=1463865 RepID=UPI00055D3805|nr:alpha/beta fold hydrolase [Streptomyces sp. NRRL F-5635]
MASGEISGTDEGTAGSWVRRFRPVGDPAVRLVCFPHAGGSASAFLPLVKALPPWVEVLAMQYPGRQDRRREQFVRSLDEFTERSLGELSRWGDRPLAFFGHSLGATIAFEVARRAFEENLETVGLFASGRRAPALPPEAPFGVHDTETAVRELARLGGTDSGLFDEPEILAMVLPALRADYHAAETYRYVPAPAGRDVDCPLVALTGDRDPVTTVADARAWSAHTSGTFRLEVFEGGHFFLTERAAAVADTVAECLRAWAPQPMRG